MANDAIIKYVHKAKYVIAWYCCFGMYYTHTGTAPIVTSMPSYIMNQSIVHQWQKQLYTIYIYREVTLWCQAQSHHTFVHLIVFRIFPSLSLWHMQLDVHWTPFSLHRQTSSSPHFIGEVGLQVQWYWGVPWGRMNLYVPVFSAIMIQVQQRLAYA